MSINLTPYRIRGIAHSRNCGGKLILAATDRFNFMSLHLSSVGSDKRLLFRADFAFCIVCIGQARAIRSGHSPDCSAPALSECRHRRFARGLVSVRRALDRPLAHIH
jgi:hypothetical protein